MERDLWELFLRILDILRIALEKWVEEEEQHRKNGEVSGGELPRSGSGEGGQAKV